MHKIFFLMKYITAMLLSPFLLLAFGTMLVIRDN